MYVDLQEDLETVLEDIRTKMNELRKWHHERIKNSFFDDDKTKQLRVQRCSSDIMALIKIGERKLKDLSSPSDSYQLSDSDDQSKTKV